MGHFNQTLFFSFSFFPRPSQSCLSGFGHQILYTNIEGSRRPQSVPTILTETVAILLLESFQMFPIFLSNKKCRLEHVVNKLMSCLITEFLWIFSYKLHGILSNSMGTLWHSMELHGHAMAFHGTA